MLNGTIYPKQKMYRFVGQKLFFTCEKRSSLSTEAEMGGYSSLGNGSCCHSNFLWPFERKKISTFFSNFEFNFEQNLVGKSFFEFCSEKNLNLSQKKCFLFISVGVGLTWLKRKQERQQKEKRISQKKLQNLIVYKMRNKLTGKLIQRRS